MMLAFVLALVATASPPSTPSPVPTACFRDVTAVETAQVIYPTSAGTVAGTVTVRVLVSVDASGKVTKTAIVDSSGNGPLDAAATRAARATTYLPKIINCVAIPGTYLFRADFSPD